LFHREKSFATKKLIKLKCLAMRSLSAILNKVRDLLEFGYRLPCLVRVELLHMPPHDNTVLEQNPNCKDLAKGDSPAAQWLTIILFLTTSSVLFVWLFEWDRYQIVAGTRAATMSLADKAVLAWLLTAKSLAWFVPWLLIWAVFIVVGLRRSAIVMVTVLWVSMFYFMAVDLISVGFAGYHIWDYFPNIEDILRSPEQHIWQWGGEQLTSEALMILCVFAISGPVCFFAVRWVTRKLVRRYDSLCSGRSAVVLTAAFIFAAFAVVPAQRLLLDPMLLDRIEPVLPFAPALKQAFRQVSEPFALWFEMSPGTSTHSGLVKVVHAKPLESDLRQKPAGDHGSLFNQDDEILATRLARDAANPGPVDPSALITNRDLPNVILIIFESFRHSALGPGLMQKLDAWTNQGLRLERHYSGSNCSHLGLFSLFYGRSALGYHQTLDRKIPGQMLESLRRSGYKITFLTSGEVKGFRRLDQFISDKTCDEVILDGEFTLKGMQDWPDSDRRKLARVRNIVNNQQGQPQFIFFYLVSSHYRYPFPPEFDIYKESPYTWQFLHPKRQMQNHLNRYANAALFLEDEVLKLANSIDPKRNLILITGDHGESMGEDGVFTHGSRMSEIQMRVPFAMVGPGVQPRKIAGATTHADVLPTLLHALAGKSVNIDNCQGRDLIEETSPSDRIAVVPANGPEWDGLMVIRENKRILFRTSAAAGEIPSVEFTGLADEAGQYELKADRGQYASGAGRKR
jgi:hypothetical protein